MQSPLVLAKLNLIIEVLINNRRQLIFSITVRERMKRNILYVMVFAFVGMLSISESKAQLFSKAKLEVTVIDGLGNPVKGAKVSLYSSQDDYQSNQNAVQSGTTDAKGKVVFKKLDTISFFIDARTKELNNDGRGVQTDVLVKMKKSKVNIVVE
jgi:hypothetical protein